MVLWTICTFGNGAAEHLISLTSCLTFGSFISHLDGPLPADQYSKVQTFRTCNLLLHRHLAFISPPVQQLHFQVIINPPGSFPSASGAEWFRRLCYITFLYGRYLEELANCCYLCLPPPLNWSPGLM